MRHRSLSHCIAALVVVVVGCGAPGSSTPDDASQTDGGPGGDAMEVPGVDAPGADAAVPKNVDFEWTAWPVPEIAPPAATYQVNGGVVLDTVTGLQWQQTVATTPMLWSVADSYCSGLSLMGTGWRLPTLIELESIVDYGSYSPSIEPTVFPNTPTQQFWSSSRGAGTTRWAVYFLWGYTGRLDGNQYVRCVRSINVAVAGSAGAPAGRYTVASDTVLDTMTGLRWQRSAPSTVTSWASAQTYCQGLSLGGMTGWRLPTVKELQSLVNIRAINPAIDTTAFPNTVVDFYFSSTPYASQTTKPWVVSFSSGDSYSHSAAGSALARCVR